MKPGISGAGCSLLDILYPDADISSEAFRRAASRSPGDGGLTPGGLVFASALEEFAGESVASLVASVCGGAEPGTNLGGPAVVALVHAAQVLASESIPVRYHGFRGDDAAGRRIGSILDRTPLDTSDYRVLDGATPQTIVLSDPHAANGAGERTFINAIGAAGAFHAADLTDEFHDLQIAFFGGTALVPALHAELATALGRAREAGQLTVVATVYDFLNESRAPDRLWPLGDGPETYPLIDLLVTDAEESRRLSGQDHPARAVAQFLEWGTGAAVVTCGDQPVHFGARAGRFCAQPPATLPVCDEVRRRAATVDPASRDTTGCGDNFTGGVLVHLARSLAAHPEAPVDLRAAVIEGVCAGAAAWFYLGGTWLESRPGEKAEMVEQFREAYRRQLEA